MSIYNSLDSLKEKIKQFQDFAKEHIFNLGKFKVVIINAKNQEEETTLKMGLYFLRNTINKEQKEQKSKSKLKDFNNLNKNIKRIFQKFIDTKELINFNKGENLFLKFNKNNSISPFKLLFCDVFRDKININALNDRCIELKEGLNNFTIFKKKYKEFHSKIQNLKILKSDLGKYQKYLKNGNLKQINEEKLEDFRIFRSLFPFNLNSEYLIDIKNENIIKL